MNKYEAKWSGTFPCLCSGKWTLLKNGEDVSQMIPERLRESPMGTRKTIGLWHFEDWNEVWENVTVGEFEANWIVTNLNWLKRIGDGPSDYSAIYAAINKQDWVYGCCGGCI